MSKQENHLLNSRGEKSNEILSPSSSAALMLNNRDFRTNAKPNFESESAEENERKQLCILTSRMGLRTASDSPQSRRSRRRVIAGQRIVRKYRRFARNREYRRLKALVPAVAKRDEVSRVEILEEAILYIDSLHARLVSSIQSNGLPASLQSRNQQGDEEEETGARNAAARSGTSYQGSLRLSSHSRNENDPHLTPERIINLVQDAFRPDMERRLQIHQRMDDQAINEIVKLSEACPATPPSTNPSSATSSPRHSSTSPTKSDRGDD